MGSALARLLNDASTGGLTLAPDLHRADVVVDYSHPDWTGPLLARLLAAPKPLVLGTTGLTDRMKGDLARLAEEVPVIHASNTGTGVNVLRSLVVDAVRRLGPGWDIEVMEMHHRRKVDAPSGTAWMLLEAAQSARDGADSALRRNAVPARVGETGARTDEEIGIQAMRGGDIVGEHTVFLIGHGERIELTHRCWDRDTFARGGLRAARWLLHPDRTPGMYSMDDVLEG
jgi:4-hydroxy-tetrahydrodipicolinate reductase